MKKYILSILLCAILVSACETSTLSDKELNTFVATATQGDLEDRVDISWIKTPYYKTYTVYRSTSDTGLFTPLISRISTDKFEDRSIVLGQEYTYKVQGYNDLGTPMYTTTPTKGFAGAKGGFYFPSNIKVSSGESIKEIKISWDRVENATKYTVYRGIDKNNLDPIGETPYLHYVDNTVEVVDGIIPTYYYAVSSFHKDGYDSQKSTPIEGILFGGNLNLRATEGQFTDKVRLTWYLLPYVTRYMIYRSDTRGAIGEKIAHISSDKLAGSNPASFDDKTINQNAIEVYYYTIVFGNALGSQQQSGVARGYRKSDTIIAQPKNLVVTKGTSATAVTLTWDVVTGAESYDISRSISINGPWEVIGSTSKNSYNDTKLPTSSYTAYYRVNAYATASGPGTTTESVEGWSVRPPLNIKASTFYGDKIQLSWDAVPGAQAYTVYYSENKDDISYKQAARIVAQNTKSQVIFDHTDEAQLNVGSEVSKTMYYKVEVVANNVISDTSSAIYGKVQKMSPPEGLRVLGNKTPTKSMTMVWKAVPNAKEYRIYRATLKHKGSNPSKLVNADYKLIGKADNTLNPSFSIIFNTYPIRRHIYTVVAINKVGEISAPAQSELVWRLPEDVLDFARDVDFTIIQAQLQIPGFGNNGSGDTVYGRGSGHYIYSASMTGSRSTWNDYNSFEVVLKGDPTITISISPIGATMNGPMDVSGLYTGRITYHKLFAKDGGNVAGGSMTVEYNHPTKGKLSEEWQYTEAGGNLLSVVLDGAESKPSYPSFEEGGG